MKGFLGVFLAVLIAGISAAMAQQNETPEWLKYKPAYNGEENAITNPHRTTEEIAAWAQQAASDVLSFSKENRVARLNTFKKYFGSRTGWQLYISYLEGDKILSMVDQGYTVNTVVPQVPEIVNRGASGGVYHWIVRMPITIGFHTNDPQTGKPVPGPSRGFYLFIDIARMTNGGGDDGIGITNWRVMDVPKN